MGSVAQPQALRVVGLDLSLTSTGMSDGTKHRVCQTTPDACVEKRLDTILNSVVQFIFQGPVWPGADLVVIEGSAFRAQGPGHEELSCLRLMVRHRLWRLKIPFAMVAPTTLKRYTTGNGRAQKSEMLAAVDARHWTEFAAVRAAHGRYDMVDAFALAAMGYAHVGQNLPVTCEAELPCDSSLDAVQWPVLYSDGEAA